jgi:predicted methyltransferase
LLAYAAAASADIAADAQSLLIAKMGEAMESNIRSNTGKGRDSNGVPIETPQFFGLRDDMRVVELAPREGWYTKILGPVLAEHGQL